MDPEKRSNFLLLSLVSHQLLPNLLLARELKPDQHLLLTTREMERSGNGDRLERLLAANGATAIDRVTVDPYDVESVRHVCQQALFDHAGRHLVLNATGGTKLTSMAAFELFSKAGWPVYYLETRPHHRIFSLVTTVWEEREVTVRLTVKEYLEACGYRVQASSKSLDHVAAREELTRFLAATYGKNRRFWGVLKAVAAEWDKQGGQAQPFFRPKPPSAMALFQRLKDAGLLFWGSGYLSFPDRAARDYVAGGWLEEWVFLETCRVVGPDDIQLGVPIKGDGIGQPVVADELDVVFTVTNRLFLVECKTAREEIVHDSVYKISSLRYLTGGVMGRSMLVSALPLSQSLQDRVVHLGLKFVGGDQTARIGHHLKAWVAQP